MYTTSSLYASSLYTTSSLSTTSFFLGTTSPADYSPFVYASLNVQEHLYTVQNPLQKHQTTTSSLYTSFLQQQPDTLYAISSLKKTTLNAAPTLYKISRIITQPNKNSMLIVFNKSM